MHRRSKCRWAGPLIYLLLLWSPEGFGQDAGDHSGHDGHLMAVTPGGVVMNENHSELPRDCSGISRDYEFTISAGREYARAPGMMFGMSRHEVRVEPCSRVRITFVNQDQVRHQ